MSNSRLFLSLTAIIGLLTLAEGMHLWAVPLPTPAQSAPTGSQSVVKENPSDAFNDLDPIKIVGPVYPRLANLARFHGNVRLSVTVAKDGSVSDIKVLSGDQHFVKAAVKAVRQWRYSPSEKDVRVTIATIVFTQRRGNAAPPALKPLTAVRPVYPPTAKATGIQGTVTLLATVEKDGSVSNLETLVGPPQLAQSAIDAVRQWRYPPMEKVSKTDVILDFTLPMGGNPEDFVTPPMAIYQPEPAYNNSKQTKAAKSQGMVRLDVMVTADGTVSDVKVTKSLDKMLDENAVQTVKTWKFLPALKAGKPVPFKTNVAISFRLF